MPGSCYSCASTFSFFKKELGCKNCGYAFCKDCLPNKIAVPKHNNEVHTVCANCFKILSGQDVKKDHPAKYSPPEAYKKRIAALENKNQDPPPAGHSKAKTQKANKQYKGMSKEDAAIAQRLEKLKEDRQKEKVASQKEIEQRLEGLRQDRAPPATTEEIAERLAVLKGQDPNTANKPHVFKKDTRSQQQQIDDLLAEIHDEVEIDSQVLPPEIEVKQRLDHLRGKDTAGPGPRTSTAGVAAPTVGKDYKSQSGEEIDINEMNRLMQQVAQESQLGAQKALQDMQNDKEIMERLNALKKERKKQSTDNASSENNEENFEKELQGKFSHLQDEFSDSEDEDEAIKRVLKQSLAEVAIENEVDASGGLPSGNQQGSKTQATTGNKKKGKQSKDKPEAKGPVKTEKTKKQQQKDSDDDLSESDEFPWCAICNEDAILKCIGCAFDFYCQRCFREYHDRLDLQDHKSIPFKARTPKGVSRQT